MQNIKRQRAIDLLINHFWQNGFITVKRKYGTYLSEPPRIGDYEVDVLAKQKKNYAIGITIIGDEIKDSGLLNRIAYLAARESRFTKKRIPLFIGVSIENLSLLKDLVNSLHEAVKSTIKIFPLFEQSNRDLFDTPSFNHSYKKGFAS